MQALLGDEIGASSSSSWHLVPEAPCDCGRQEAAGGLVLIHPSKTQPEHLPHQSPAVIIGMCANSPQSGLY